MAHIKELFEMYKDIDDEKLFENLKYFPERIMPTCDKIQYQHGDPSRRSGMERNWTPTYHHQQSKYPAHDEDGRQPNNGVTFCSGSYGTNLENDLPDMIRSKEGRIHFAHVKNFEVQLSDRLLKKRTSLYRWNL